MCISNLKEIAAFCSEQGNSTGIKTKLRLTPEAAVESIPDADPDTHTVSGDIVMRAADGTATPPVEAGVFAVWNLSIADNVNNFAVESEGDPDGKTYVTTVTTQIPRLTSEKTHALFQTSGAPIICLARDKNNELRIIGEKENGAYVAFTENTADKNRYDVTVTWRSAAPPLFYTGAIVE